MTKDIVKSVVDKADPIGLLGMCCPADEYDSEIEIIFARIRKGMSADEIAKVIHAVFLEMFSESIDTMCKEPYTSLLFRNMPAGSFATTGTNNDAAELLNSMRQPVFDNIRDTEAFKSIRDELSAYAGKWDV